MNARPVPQRGEPLNDRELEVLDGISQGRTAAAIGRAMGLSEDSMKGYSVRVRRKLGALFNANAVLVAVREGLLS